AQFYAHASQPVGTTLETAAAPDPQPLSPGGPTVPPSPAQAQPESSPNLQLDSEIIGQPVPGRHQQDVGQVAELLIDFAQQKHPFAIVSAGSLFHPGHDLAIPLGLCLAQPQGELLVRASQQDIDHAPLFGESIWRAAGQSPAGKVYRYPDGDSPQAS